MINYKEPVVELNPAPVALDNAIQKIQEKLSTLSWLQKAFGKCTPQKFVPDEVKSKSLRTTYLYPEAYYKREPFSLMPNDNLKSYCFFHAKDEMKFLDWESFTMPQSANQPLAIIFWANLQKINPSKNYNFIEELRLDVVKILKRCPDFKAESSSIQYDKVFDPFTITETYRPFIKPPYGAFRIDGTLSFDYLQNC